MITGIFEKLSMLNREKAELLTKLNKKALLKELN
jgi:hypothetical protein